MILGWLAKRLARVVVDLTIILLVFTLLPGIPPHVPYTTFEELKPPLALEGVLERNDLLNDAERVLDGKIVGPESIASRDPEEIFVSLHGGKILRIWGPKFDHIKVVASIGPGCDAPWEEHICGRPLGMRFAPDGRLLVADAYLGLFAVDVDTGEKESLFDINQAIEGAVAKIPDDLDIDNDGFIYWSDASAHDGLDKAMIEFLASPSGRLFRFDPQTKTNKVLIKNLHFANGVQLSPDHSFVLVNECFKNRVYRHWLRGPRAGETEMFVERLPGMPDNIRPNGKGGYYISLISINSKETTKIMAILGKMPLLRKLGLRLMYVTRMFMEMIGKLDSSRTIDKLASMILHLGPISELNKLKSNLTIVVEVDGDGKIIDSLQGDSGQLVLISETQRVGDYMFFGSPYNKYLGRIYVGLPMTMEVEGKGVRMKSEEEVEEERLKKEGKEESKSEEEVKEEKLKKEGKKESKSEEEADERKTKEEAQGKEESKSEEVVKEESKKKEEESKSEEEVEEKVKNEGVEVKKQVEAESKTEEEVKERIKKKEGAIDEAEVKKEAAEMKEKVETKSDDAVEKKIQSEKTDLPTEEQVKETVEPEEQKTEKQKQEYVQPEQKTEKQKQDQVKEHVQPEEQKTEKQKQEQVKEHVQPEEQKTKKQKQDQVKENVQPEKQDNVQPEQQKQVKENVQPEEQKTKNQEQQQNVKVEL